MAAISIWHWLMLLLVVLLIFGTKQMRNLVNDLGQAIRRFREGVKSGDKENAPLVPSHVTNQPGTREMKQGSRGEG